MCSREIESIGKHRLACMIADAVHEEVSNALFVDLSAEAFKPRQLHDLGSKGDAAATRVIDDWLDPETISRKEQLLIAVVPDGQSKHSGELW